MGDLVFSYKSSKTTPFQKVSRTLKNRELLFQTNFAKIDYFPPIMLKKHAFPKIPMDHLQPTRRFTWPFLTPLKKSSFLGLFLTRAQKWRFSEHVFSSFLGVEKTTCTRFETICPVDGCYTNFSLLSNAVSFIFHENVIFLQEILDFQKSWFC